MKVVSRRIGGRNLRSRSIEQVMTDPPVIVWFRQDLRIGDQPALVAAAETGRPVVPLYVLDDFSPGRIGGASRWWLHGSLMSLAADLDRLGSPLVLRRGPSADVVTAVARETNAAAVHCTCHVEPFWLAADRELQQALPAYGTNFVVSPGTTLFAPKSITGRDGSPLRVFTAFWRACMAAAPPPFPLAPPSRLRAPELPVRTEALADWRLLPGKPDWSAGLKDSWVAGESEAQLHLEAFAAGAIQRYADERDRPDLPSTSRLSPHLHFGEISPRHVWHAVNMRMQADVKATAGGGAYLRQLGWREFCAHSLALHPDMPDSPLQKRFTAFPWHRDDKSLRAWQRGRTGYPMVDAGMRQLWHTGWMHNRLRMITASFLVKHLLVHWHIGEAWFWDTLVDADLANNAAGWQWVAGCGIDAVPYFRIFNPLSQGEKFDPCAEYIRQWVPEIARLPNAIIHRPWRASAGQLADAGVRLGQDYSLPIIDHALARKHALAAFSKVS